MLARWQKTLIQLVPYRRGVSLTTWRKALGTEPLVWADLRGN